MTLGYVVICERTGDWAVACRRGLRSRAEPASIRVAETRNLDEFSQVLEERPKSFGIVELRSDNCDAVLELLAAGSRDRSDRQLAVVASREMAPYDGLARELGAVHVIMSIREVPALMDLVKRYFAGRDEMELALADRIQASLPWSKPIA